MAYTDAAVQAKLSALNETQEGIVTVAQWIMFHRRHADRTAQLWTQKLKDSTAGKKLNLVYLANEVIQQSKARRKTEFVAAFAPIMVEAAQVAYRNATQDIQQKLRRVIEVWRQRGIFDLPVQGAIETAITEIDKTRNAGKKQGLGGSLFSSTESSIPEEMQPLVPLQIASHRAASQVAPLLDAARAEYERLNDAASAAPPPPVHAAQLSALMKSLASAESVIVESLRTRQALYDEVDRLLSAHRAVLEQDRITLAELQFRREATEKKKREVEDGIMLGLSEDETFAGAAHAHAGPGAAASEPERPLVEALTPPEVESLTPVGSPRPGPMVMSESDTNPPEPDEVSRFLDATATHIASKGSLPLQSSAPPLPLHPGADLLSSLTTLVRPRSDEDMDMSVALASAKRRKTLNGAFEDDAAAFGNGDALDGLDDDVAQMLTEG